MAKKHTGQFLKAFRQYAVERLKQCDNIMAFATPLGISRRLLSTWRDYQVDSAATSSCGFCFAVLGHCHEVLKQM